MGIERKTDQGRKEEGEKKKKKPNRKKNKKSGIRDSVVPLKIFLFLFFFFFLFYEKRREEGGRRIEININPPPPGPRGARSKNLSWPNSAPVRPPFLLPPSSLFLFLFFFFFDFDSCRPLKVDATKKKLFLSQPPLVFLAPFFKINPNFFFWGGGRGKFRFRARVGLKIKQTR